MIYVICGPTGSGKTEVANILSDYLNCDIINADAFQIYQDMDIGTAKLDKSDKYYSRYHLLDIVTPETSFSVKQYQDLFRQTIDKLLKKNKDVIVCGGTGLYIKAALYDYKFNEEESIDEHKYDEFDNHKLWLMLNEIDPEDAKKIHENNRKRIIRALNIYDSQKINKSEQINQQEHKLIYQDVRFLFINPNREDLYQKINLRVDNMIERGLFLEVENLNKKYRLSKTAKEAIGYKEVLDYLSNNIDKEKAIELIKQRTRNYAKRQVTFFKHQFVCEQFESPESILKVVINNG